MRLNPKTLALLLGAAFAAPATAERPPANKGEKHPEPPRIDHKAYFAILDTNKDGKVTLEEFKKNYQQLVRHLPPSKAAPKPATKGGVICETCGRG